MTVGREGWDKGVKREIFGFVGKLQQVKRRCVGLPSSELTSSESSYSSTRNRLCDVKQGCAERSSRTSCIRFGTVGVFERVESCICIWGGVVLVLEIRYYVKRREV